MSPIRPTHLSIVTLVITVTLESIGEEAVLLRALRDIIHLGKSDIHI
jgi:hypothetical protein